VGSQVEAWLGAERARPDGSVARIPTRRAVLGGEAASVLAKDARALAPGGQTIVVCDAWTRPIAAPVVAALREQGCAASFHQVASSPDGSPPSADDDRVRELFEASGAAIAEVVVSVGSGTVTDIAKAAATKRGIHVLAYGTAASMNGYTSNIAALYSGGLKVTRPVEPVWGVYADPAVVAAAPAEMNLAGLGDLCSKPFSGSDAAIASLAKGETPWRLPAEMVEVCFKRTLERAEDIGRSDPTALSELMEALWVSGFSMALAGSSAPASGGEHLWSHRLDMLQHDRGLPPVALHGTQVGVACGLVRPLFEGAAAMDPDEAAARLAEEPAEPDPAGPDFRAWLDARHPDLGPVSMEAVRAEASSKYAREKRRRARADLRERWQAVRVEVADAATHALRIDEALARAGAPRLPEEIGVGAEEADRLLTVCRDIRDRLTILDLAADVVSG